MARPGIVRADTIDLQPQTSPSAQDHSRTPHKAAQTAPHQAAELRHVQEERHSEEENLSNAWNSASGLSDEPPSDDDDTTMRDDQSVQQNGQQNGNSQASDTEGDEGMEDDMLDKISSSPSISDGGYPNFNMARSLSMLPDDGSPVYTPTPIHKTAHHGKGTVVEDNGDSSPALPTTPQLPSHLSTTITARTPSPFPFLSGCLRSARRPRLPSEEPFVESDRSSSPFTEVPAHFPLHFQYSREQAESRSFDHHAHESPSSEVREVHEDPETSWTETQNHAKHAPDSIVGVEHMPMPEGQSEVNPALVKSESQIEFEAQLLPLDDPLLDDVFVEQQLDAQNLAPDEDDEDWETESDTKYSEDSFESDDYPSDDETRDSKLPADGRFIDSGWGGECLRETEDIDFEFVYALHTFVATVEGQANAQKGDTMVLLDDSNSYWWLVRVVKDSTIGYLPAEHIETPTERLARLNKHRNVDLSQAMLGDNTEKTKNPLKKAMRRRNAKTVTFTAPTYIEPSEYEYTTDDESDDDVSLTNGSNGAHSMIGKDQTNANGEKDEISAVAPLKVKDKKRDMSPEKRGGSEDGEDGDRRRKIDESRASDEQLDREFAAQKQTRNGTPRNTDSFFRDESIETRKITLTPNILRDDSSGSNKSSLERGPSLELFEKDPKPSKASKKEKKPGMLSGLFKRKEKKGKGDDASSTKGKLSGETLRESISSDDASPIERPGTADGSIQRTGSKGKLQKSPPSTTPNSASPAPLAMQKKPSMETVSAESSTQSTPRAGSPVQADKPLEKSSSLRARASESISSKLRTTTTPDETKPAKVKRAKQREALDVESSPDEEANDPFADTETIRSDARLTAPGAAKLGAMSSTERLSDSPVHITSADAMPDNEPPALVGDNSSSSSDELTSLRSSPSPPLHSTQEQQTRTPIANAQISALAVPTSSSSNLPAPAREPPIQPDLSTSQRDLSPARNNSTSTTNSALSPAMSPSPVWSDAHLRAYMDTTEDIRDLLVVVHDTRGVVPVGPDHPLMSNLFVEERGKVKELDTALDKMLSQWLMKKRVGTLARKGSTPTLGSRLANSTSA